jgi:hypothetical protein
VTVAHILSAYVTKLHTPEPTQKQETIQVESDRSKVVTMPTAVA